MHALKQILDATSEHKVVTISSARRHGIGKVDRAFANYRIVKQKVYSGRRQWILEFRVIKEMMQHLKQLYSRPLYEKDLKAYFFWKNLS